MVLRLWSRWRSGRSGSGTRCGWCGASNIYSTIESRICTFNLYTCVAAMAYSARLRAHDRRPPRAALQPRDVDLDVDEARRAHRSVRHARVAVAHTAPHEVPAGPQDSQQLREDVGNGVRAREAGRAGVQSAPGESPGSGSEVSPGLAPTPAARSLPQVAVPPLDLPTGIAQLVAASATAPLSSARTLTTIKELSLIHI